LEDEGCIYPSGFTGTPLEMFDSLDAANKQLTEHAPELGNTFNTLVGRLDRLCSMWFADGTVGDTYAQYITIRSGDPAMQADLVKARAAAPNPV
jgi:hypothetical protein